MQRRTLLGLLATTTALAMPTAVGAAPYEHKTQPTAQGTGGAAATVDSVATTAATDVLRQGGNAVDAAVAAAAVLGVTEPFSCGIGGGGFMVIRTPDGEVTTIDSREKSPAAMRPDSFFENGSVLSFNDARYSGLSAGVPGTVDAWNDALRRYGTWDFDDVLAPAIDVAREGFVVDPTFISQITPNIAWFNDIPSTAELYLDSDGTCQGPRTPCCATRISPRRTSGSRRSGRRRASTAATWPRRSSTRSRIRRPQRPPTRHGGPV